MKKKCNVPAKELLELYGTGKTLGEIGDREGITRERVRQLISVFPEYKEIKSRRKEEKWVTKTCKNCGKSFIDKYFRNNTIFCSRPCFFEFTKNSNNEKRAQLTKKRCPKCKKIRKIENFYRYKLKDGRTKIHCYCKDCYKKIR